jgi:diacylglycerol O-acyltransferase / wax synthase
MIDRSHSGGVERISGLDGAFLALESSTSPLHIVGVLLLDRVDAAPEVVFRRIRAVIGDRLTLVPPFRMRLVDAPLGVGRPGLVDDPRFDLDYHVRGAGLPRPGGRRELAGLVADIASRPLDRRRPLWEMHVVDGTASEGAVVVAKVHHAIIDGVAGAELLSTFFDLEADAPSPVARLDLHRPTTPRPPEPGPWPGVDLEQWREVLESLPGHLDATVRSVGQTLRRARSVATRWRGQPTATPPLPLLAPRTSINGSISPHRRVAFGDLAMSDVRRVRQVLGGTANDVVLASTAGSLRRFFSGRGEEMGRPLVAMVPVSVRAEAEHGQLGNRLSALFVSLPVEVDEPAERLRAVRESVAVAKETDRSEGQGLVRSWAEATVPAVAARASQMATDRRLFDRIPPLFNVIVSNVPGPDFPLYLAGCRLAAMYPFGPIFEGAAVNITVISYLDRIHVGVQGCWDLVPDVDVIARGIEDSLAELVRTADRRNRPVPWWHAEIVPA